MENGTKILVVASCIFVFMQVFSSIQLIQLILHNEVIWKFIFWSFTLTLVIQACYEYHLTWARVPRIVRGMSGNFAVSGEWSPCILCRVGR